jgi:hypothetical protein
MSNINNHNEEEEIRGLLDSIKQQGMPYSEEPDPLYWANFRVRVMERVAEPERISIFAKAKSWLWESGLRTGLVGGGLAVLLLGGIYFSQNDQPLGDVAMQTKPADQQQQAKPVDTVAGQVAGQAAGQADGEKEEIKQLDAIPSPFGQTPDMAQSPKVETPVTEQPRTIETMSEAETAAPLLAADLGVQGPATSLDDMTEEELQALLASVEAMN